MGAAPLPTRPPPPKKPAAPDASPPGRRARPLAGSPSPTRRRRLGGGPPPRPTGGDSLRPALPMAAAAAAARHGAESVPSLAAAEELARDIEDSDYESDITNGESGFARPVVPWDVAAAVARPSGDDEWGGARSFRHVKLVLGEGCAALGGPLVLPCSVALARFLGSAASALGVARGESCPLLFLDERGYQVETVFQIRQMCAVQQPGSQHPFQSWFCVAKPAQPRGGGWGLFSRCRRLQEGDAVLFTFPTEFDPTPEEAPGRPPPPSHLPECDSGPPAAALALLGAQRGVRGGLRSAACAGGVGDPQPPPPI